MTQFYSFSEAWVSRLIQVAYNGDQSSPRGMPTRELRWDQIEIGNPLTFPMQVNGREMKDVIGVLEATSLVGQFSVPELFTSRVRKFGDFMDSGVFHGSYGSRVYGRLGDLVDLLARDPSGYLWHYAGLGNGTFAARVKVGTGWNMYKTIF